MGARWRRRWVSGCGEMLVWEGCTAATECNSQDLLYALASRRSSGEVERRRALRRGRDGRYKVTKDVGVCPDLDAGRVEK